MSKRYRETLERVVQAGQVPTGGAGTVAAEATTTYDPATPVAFTWRGSDYQVRSVLGHWREDAGWWRGNDGRTVRIQQADLWRVEAAGGPAGSDGRAAGGVYELVHRDGQWRLDRVWD